QTDRWAGLSFSPDGGRLATVGAGSVRIWDVSTGKESHWFSARGSRSRGVFSPDGSYLASFGSSEPSVTVWSVPDGAERFTLKQPTSRLLDVAFSPDGKRLAGAGIDGVVTVWNLFSRDQVSYRGHVGEVRSVCFSPDGQRIASADSACTVRVWDAL